MAKKQILQKYFIDDGLWIVHKHLYIFEYSAHMHFCMLNLWNWKVSFQNALVHCTNSMHGTHERQYYFGAFFVVAVFFRLASPPPLYQCYQCFGFSSLFHSIHAFNIFSPQIQMQNVVFVCYFSRRFDMISQFVYHVCGGEGRRP